MPFNLFSVIAASAISASVAQPSHAIGDSRKPSTASQSYTTHYLQQSAQFYAALGRV